MDICGVYMQTPACGHTYGIWALNHLNAYDALDRVFRSHPLRGKWFRQSDTNYKDNGDKSGLFIEFLGQGLDEYSALEQCEAIAKEMGYHLQILD